MPLELCIPAVTDLVAVLYGGIVRGASLSQFKIKKKDDMEGHVGWEGGLYGSVNKHIHIMCIREFTNLG